MGHFNTKAQVISAAIWSRLRRPEAAIFLPLLALASYWLAGERGILLLLVVAPLSLGLLRFGLGLSSGGGSGFYILSEGDFRRHAAQILLDMAASGQKSCCFFIKIVDLQQIETRHGAAMRAKIFARLADRIGVALREGDVVARLGPDDFGICLRPVPRFDLENAVQVAARLQKAITAPLAMTDLVVQPNSCVGFCISDLAATPAATAWIDGARAAADEALRNGAAAIRGFQPEMLQHRTERAVLRTELEAALDRGDIQPWFQPQLSTDSGDISGFAAVARWNHPEKGMLQPQEFVPLIEEAGLSERLGEVILFGALAALVRWEKAGHRIPTICVNFPAIQLRNPHLPERLRWEMDRLGLRPARLVVEVPEGAAAQFHDEVIVANLSKIADLGCGIDLDDFGIGPASISNIRRFSVGRLKIDRAFVSRCDSDPKQKQMVGAILALCERLELETIAEGVATAGEHVTLAQLGCAYVQGPIVARVMAMADTFDWIAQYEQSQRQSFLLGRGGSSG